ncbi:MAG: cyclodeaminase/cyclohydrolase family protein [Candidatus Omnitrophica bacterium]|nr:cyclodeaminase/cyclohydrolase family protein [Candidatus Omnitrophota bacterium]
MGYRERSLRKYIDDLSKKLPAPGGGSASSLVCGLGVSLLGMVINFTLGKPGYQDYEKELKKILIKVESLKKRFLELVDEDVKAYKSKDIWYSLEVPLKVAYNCYEAIRISPLLLKKGNKNLLSDVACGVIFLEAGFWGAYFNVEANLKFIKEKKIVNKIRKELLREASHLKRIKEEVEKKVGVFIKGN